MQRDRNPLTPWLFLAWTLASVAFGGWVASGFCPRQPPSLTRVVHEHKPFFFSRQECRNGCYAQERMEKIKAKEAR